MQSANPQYPILLLPDYIESFLKQKKRHKLENKNKNSSQLISSFQVKEKEFSYQGKKRIDFQKGLNSLKSWHQRVIYGCYGVLGLFFIHDAWRKEFNPWNLVGIGLVLAWDLFFRWGIIYLHQKLKERQPLEDKLYWESIKTANQKFNLFNRRNMGQRLKEKGRLRVKKPNSLAKSDDNSGFDPKVIRGIPIPITKKINKGVSEAFLLDYLKQSFPQLLITEDYFPLNESIGYTTDFALISPRGFAVDLEIDEPYAGESKKPHHCWDDQRDYNRNGFFLERGWVVLRVSEYQVVHQPESVCRLIGQLFYRLTGDFNYLEPLLEVESLTPDDCWSSIKAKKLAKRLYREIYLDKAGIYRQR